MRGVRREAFREGVVRFLDPDGDPGSYGESAQGDSAPPRIRLVTRFGCHRPILWHATLRQTPSDEQIPMAMPTPTQRHWTTGEVRELMDAEPWPSPRYELIDGELIVTPSPAIDHYRVLMRVYHILHAYLEREPVGEAMLSPADLELRPGTISQPDIFVPTLDEARRARRWSEVRHLLLAVEVLSPSSARIDRGKKRRHYQASGVAEYWIIDPESRLVERWRPEDDRPEILSELLAWHPRGAGAALEIELGALFADPPPE
jgi:Uma2 family endonuclease